jgi:hypothetical protein
MNAAQTSLYFREWSAVRRHFIARGIDPKLADNKRHELHVKALGRAMSSKDFRNADLDKVLGVFRAITRPGDLNAQLHVEDSEIERRAEALEGCRLACWEMYLLGDNRMARGEIRERYIAGTARGILKKEPADCYSWELNKVLGALRRRVGVLRRDNPRVAASMDADAAARVEVEPF